jgi:hypothetical protein
LIYLVRWAAQVKGGATDSIVKARKVLGGKETSPIDWSGKSAWEGQEYI